MNPYNCSKSVCDQLYLSLTGLEINVFDDFKPFDVVVFLSKFKHSVWKILDLTAMRPVPLIRPWELSSKFSVQDSSFFFQKSPAELRDPTHFTYFGLETFLFKLWKDVRSWGLHSYFIHSIFTIFTLIFFKVTLILQSGGLQIREEQWAKSAERPFPFCRLNEEKPIRIPVRKLDSPFSLFFFVSALSSIWHSILLKINIIELFVYANHLRVSIKFF